MKRVVGMLAIVGLCVLAYWFWPGEEPNLPKGSEVREIRLVQGQVVVTIDQSEEIAVFLAELGNAKKPIKIVLAMHLRFHPMCRITFVMAEGETTAFAYEGNTTKLSGVSLHWYLQAERAPSSDSENASRLGLIVLTKKREIMSLTSKQRAFLNSQAHSPQTHYSDWEEWF